MPKILLDGHLVPVVKGFSLIPVLDLADCKKTEGVIGAYDFDKHQFISVSAWLLPVYVRVVNHTERVTEFNLLVKLRVGKYSATGTHIMDMVSPSQFLDSIGGRMHVDDCGYWLKRFEPFDVATLAESTARYLVEQKFADVSESLFWERVQDVVFSNI